jgi:hypothetical protein
VIYLAIGLGLALLILMILFAYTFYVGVKVISQLDNEIILALSTIESHFGTAQGQTSQVKGKLGELATYLRLKADYDRIYSVSGICDFIGFKLDGEVKQIDFIEVKTNTSRLSKDQQAAKKVVLDKNINWITIKIDSEINQGEEIK